MLFVNLQRQHHLVLQLLNQVQVFFKIYIYFFEFFKNFFVFFIVKIGIPSRGVKRSLEIEEFEEEIEEVIELSEIRNVYICFF